MNLFPSPEEADEDGLVLVGGQVNEQWLDEAYQAGIFPWPIVDTSLSAPLLCWFSPDPRAVLYLDAFHVSRRLRRRIRQRRFQITCNEAFQQVITACAMPRDDGGTWITRRLQMAYSQYAKRGKAVSIEVWEDGVLVGGLYGVTLGGYFSAESMFHTTTDGSKIALWALVQLLKQRGATWLDVQIMTPHLKSLGATEISRPIFLERLRFALSSAPAVAWPATFTAIP